MKFVAIMALFASACLAEDAPKPVCNAKNHGSFWPAEANSSQEAARRLSQSGELELCSIGTFKYKWVHISVNVRDLAKGRDGLRSEPKKAGTDARK